MIPVFEPIIGEEEILNVVDALKKGEISGTFGSYIQTFEREFAAYCGCRHGIAVTSGSTALQMAVRAIDVGRGDEVLMSTSTNISTALGIVHNQAVPVPVDSESTTWNLNLDLIESLITPKTKAIIPVHLFGHPVNMDVLMEIARKHNLRVIEDCAESHGATVFGRMTGSFGDLGCYSFYANKIITTGEGGMVVTNDDDLADKLRLLRNVGFTEPRFRHEIAAYNYRMTGYQAAFGLAQLKKIESVISDKRRIAHTYNKYLSEVPGLQLPVEMEWARNVYWMYAVCIQPEFGLSRDEFAKQLREKGVDTRTFFCPMNQQPCLLEIPDFRAIPCPVGDYIWDSGLYLPSTCSLTDEDIHGICELIQEIRN
ncbi:MAG: DegT/DnrJ/EryC1/StrS family aminotransferase [Candidatus Hinthialibacter antarcticus]|nr:DegT/DnrJ/EryC1/StrS family aminotransferase [Candidatus Hinthialibacter antarcticus]